MTTEALKLALEALEMFCEHGAILRPIETRDAIKEALAQPQQEPVKFLAYGSRFKISYAARKGGGKICGIPDELAGRWVALVAAENDRHLSLTTPPQRQPLTDKQVEKAAPNYAVDDFLDFNAGVRFAEAAHGITAATQLKE